MELVSLTQDLAAIPSHEDERAAGDAIAEWLRAETDAVLTRDDAGNVIARRGDDGPSLALIGHHDVVPPDEVQLAEDGTYRVERRGDRLYGRGTADMKGAVAAAMLAFRDAKLSSEAELVFASFAGEESGGVGCRAAIADGFGPDYAVVGEGSTGYSAAGVTDVAVAHKGRRGATITAHGRAAHASEVEAGVNAIYRATDAVAIVRDLAVPTTDVHGNDVSGSLAATEIEGGTAWNVIPETCTVTVDERTVPGVRASLDRVETIEGVELQIDQDLPPMACEDEAFADAVLGVAADTQDGSPEQFVKPHATDAGWLAQAGTDCVVCGPAEPGEAHTADESVSIPALERCASIYRTVAESFPFEA